jgi:uncharacterized ion transporter superfamily protein YfcC
LIFDRKEENEAHFRNAGDATTDFTGLHKIVLILFGTTFAVMIWGVSLGGWWMAEMSGLFLFAGIAIGLIRRLGEKGLVDAFVGGARDLLGIALIIGLARGIVVVMDAGHMTDTVLYWAEGTVAGLSNVVFINVMYWFEVVLAFFVPSTSGLAVLSMPVLAPVGDFAGVGRSLIVTSFQSATGVVNFIRPTSAVVMGGLAIARVPYERWLRFVWPILLGLTINIMVALSIGAFMGGTPT